MSACVTYIMITRIAQVTLKTINNTLLIYKVVPGFVSFTLSSRSIFRLTNTGWMVVCTFRLRSLGSLLTISAEIWSLNGKITRAMSSVSLGGDKGCCWSQTFVYFCTTRVMLTIGIKRVYWELCWSSTSFIFVLVTFPWRMWPIKDSILTLEVPQTPR